VNDAIHYVRGGKVAKLKAAKRNKLSDSKFGLPGSRKYPVNDKAHAANAKARATQMVKKGKLRRLRRRLIRCWGRVNDFQQLCRFNSKSGSF
jgi:hypothetical protein